MKLKDILNEGPGHKSFGWRNDLTFQSQLRAVRNYLRANSDPQIAAIYQQAMNDGRFAPEDIIHLRQII
jgi:hypothetical protein